MDLKTQGLDSTIFLIILAKVMARHFEFVSYIFIIFLNLLGEVPQSAYCARYHAGDAL